METVTEQATEIKVDTTEAGVKESIDARVVRTGIAALEAAEAEGVTSAPQSEGLDEDKVRAAMAVNSRSTR